MDGWSYCVPEGSAVVRTEGVAENLHTTPVMEARNALHQMTRGVIAEVGRHVANTKPSFAGAPTRILVGRLMKNRDL